MKKLFWLINSLSGAEKRYITTHSRKDTKSAELFITLKEMPDYIRHKVPNNLAPMKDHLYDTILKQMRIFRSDHNKTSQIKGKLLDLQFLYEKNLFEQCWDKLKEIQEEAQSCGDLHTLLEINKEKRYLARFYKSQNHATDLEKLIEESKNLVALLNLEMDYYNAYDQLFDLTQKEEEVSKSTLEDRLPIQLSPPLEVPSTMHVERRYYLCHALFHYLLDDFDQFYSYSQKVKTWWINYNNYKQEAPYHYLNDLQNYFLACMKKKQYNYAKEVFEDLDNFGKVRDEKLRAFIREKTLSLKLYYYLNRQLIKDGLRLVPLIEKTTAKFNPSQTSLLFNTTLLLFLAKEYEDCSKWCVSITRKRSITLKSLQKAVRLFNLICHYELQYNPASFSNVPPRFRIVLKNTASYFNNKTELGENGVVLTFVDYVTKIENALPGKDYQLFQELLTFLGKQSAEALPGVEALIIWVKLKIDTLEKL